MTSNNWVPKEKDDLDHEVTALHSELFQAKFTLTSLKKQTSNFSQSCQVTEQ